MGVGTVVIWPDGVMRASVPSAASLNQMLPSGPATIQSGRLLGVGTGNTLMATGATVPEGFVRSSNDSRRSRARPPRLAACRVPGGDKRDRKVRSQDWDDMVWRLQ